jgi:imidazoleglycerol phosphate synthase cyclase subunit
MLSKRIIPCLDVRDGKTTKGIKFKENVDIGDPVEMARFYYEEGADEIVFYDITASSERRDIMIDVVRRVAEEIFIPFSVGGGIRTIEDMRAVLLAGAEKVSVNTAAVKNPEIIRVECKSVDESYDEIIIYADPSDVGKLIGKEGRMINSIKTVISGCKAKGGKSYRVNVQPIS